MAPIILARDWLILHPSYAALDEYLRWAQSRQGGQINVHPQSGEITYRKHPESGAILPTTVYRNILDHLDHVFTKDGTGPSVLNQILEMLPDSSLKNLRSVSKSIGTAATKAICKTLRLPTDSFTNTYGGGPTTLIDFIKAFTKSVQRVSGRLDPIYDHPAIPGFKLPSWSMNTDYVKELYFYPDPINEQRVIKLYTDFNQQLEANDIFDPSIAIRATLQEGKDLLEHPHDIAFQEYWHLILFFIEHCTNLEVFTWDSTLWQPVELLQVLAFNCPKLAKLDLNFSEPLLEPGGISKDTSIPDLKHKVASEIEQITYTLPLDMEIHLRVAVRRDEYILPILLHLGAFTRKVDTLIIDRSLSDVGYSAWEQGWDTESRLLVFNGRIKPATQSLFEVRSLSMISIGNKSRYVMPLLDTTGLREIVINGCLNVEFILEPLVRNAKYLTSVAIQFGDAHAEYVEEPLRYHHLKVQDSRYALDFVRAGNFTLTDLLLHADFADSKRTPKSYSLLVPDLWFAIQAHMPTLVRLSVLNPQDDFRVTDIEELGRCAPRLQELRIQARMGYPLYGMPEPRSEGLAYSLKRALLAFRTHKTLRVLAIMKSYSADFNPMEDPEHRTLVMNNNLGAVVNAINHGVPIKLFTFMEEPLRQPATCHFFYNKTPFEPDVTWGVYPYPPPPVRKDAQYFKGFEFHEKIPGLKGQVFHEQGNKMLIRHGELVKELQLWHPETKRGGGTFSPERLKLPSDTVRTIQQPIPPASYVGDFGDPRRQEYDAAILAVRSAKGLSPNSSFNRRLGSHPAVNHGKRGNDWAVARNPNAKKYHISKGTRRSAWNNPNKIRASRKEKMLRISEEDRNKLFGKELPSYDPIPLSESEFNRMTGQQLYEWEDLYNVLDEESIRKLTLLESPTTERNREEQYAILSKYAPKDQAWDIDNPLNFTLAKYSLCTHQRVFILKAAVIKKLVILEPISEAKFWAKEANDQLVWCHLNGYVNPRLYPRLTLSFALQPLSSIVKNPLLGENIPADDAYEQWIAFFDDVHNLHIPHARAAGKILPNPILEGAFNEITNFDLYNWAVTRGVLNPVSDADQKKLANTNQLPYVELLAGTLRGEILRKAAQKGFVTVEVPTEKEVRSMSDESLYHWAVSRNILRPSPLESTLASEIVAIGPKKAARAAEKKEEIVLTGIVARYIIGTPIVPRETTRRRRAPAPTVEDENVDEMDFEGEGERITRRTRARYVPSQPEKTVIGGNRKTFQLSEADGFVDNGDVLAELRQLSKDDLILKVMGMCTDTPIMKRFGMKGLLEAVSQYEKDELIGLLLEGVEVDEEGEEEEEDEY